MTTKTAKKAPAKKTAKKKASAKKAPAKKQDKLSAIDAAARVLGESKEPLNCKQMVEAMAAKGYWKSPGGATPHATLYTVVTRVPNLAP